MRCWMLSEKFVRVLFLFIFLCSVAFVLNETIFSREVSEDYKYNYRCYDSYRDKESLRGCDLYPAATAASLLTGPVIFNCHGVILPLFNY